MTRLFTLFAVVALGAGVPRNSRERLIATQSSGPVLPVRQISGAIMVLQHRGDAFNRAPKWSIATTPIATAGGADAPEFDLTRAWYVELLSDGRLVTLAPIGNRLLVFAPDGRGEKRLGRQGQGPGELMAPTGMSRIAGDTLIVPDRANNRINWIVAAKGFVASKPMPSIARWSSDRPVGALRTGTFVLASSGMLQAGVQDSVTRPPASVVVLSQNAETAMVAATIPDFEVIRIPAKQRGRAGFENRTIRFSRQARTVAWDTVIATGSGNGYTIDLRGADGVIRSSLRVAIRRRAVTKAMRDSVVATALRHFEGPRAEALIDPAESRRLEQVTPSADSLPPYGDWFVTRSKILWVVDAAAPGDTTGSATAFRQDGALLGRLTWSGRGTPATFGDDRVVMRETDSDGVVSLRIYRIVTGAR